MFLISKGYFTYNAKYVISFIMEIKRKILVKLKELRIFFFKSNIFFLLYLTFRILICVLGWLICIFGLSFSDDNKYSENHRRFSYALKLYEFLFEMI
jgi:hypothetical protein